MPLRSDSHALRAVLPAILLLTSVTCAFALETRLAGIRLDDPAQAIREVYGEPDAVATRPVEGAVPAIEFSAPPAWGIAASAALKPGETQWFYRRAGVLIGVVLDPGARARLIAVAGQPADPRWRPSLYVRLGDGYRRVLYRYGLPERAGGPGNEPAPPPAPEEGLGAFGRDGELWYGDGKARNIAFTIDDQRVVRIIIWRPDA